ncbi:hypothetical protein CEXT_45421 [Caerostris extrusa]|uniref:Uncharacterized protein n=1 Tax=Caerostris extrusa TaxID=172846 RepID=A0AAV4VLF1_CAEEX|nr:hypothetical protein CEXT_45421 [Caerostris extrusa]
MKDIFRQTEDKFYGGTLASLLFGVDVLFFCLTLLNAHSFLIASFLTKAKNDESRELAIISLLAFTGGLKPYSGVEIYFKSVLEYGLFGCVHEYVN